MAEAFMEAPGWLAPATGAIAMGTSLAFTGVYAYGRIVPATHDVSVHATIPVPPEVVWELLTDVERRPEWRPHVARVGRIADTVDGHKVWRELDRGDDRFDFVVVEETPAADGQPARFVTAVGKPEDLGMTGQWTWTVAPAGSGTDVTVSQTGTLDNEFYRGWWWLKNGPYHGIESDLVGLAHALGADVEPERVR